MAWVIEFYGNEAEGCPVREFLLGLNKPRRAKVVALIQQLGEHGPTLPFPYSSHIRGKLYELRGHYGREQYRVLYFGAPGRVFVLLHAFVKRTATVPERDIKLAEERMKVYLRATEKPR